MQFFTIAVLVSGITAQAFGEANADLANTGFQLMEEANNPRLVGMGGAGTAVPGRGFFQYNPALPGLSKQSYLSLEFGTYPQGDLRRGLLETAWTMNSFFLGIALKTESIRDIFPATFQGPNYSNPFTAQLTEVALGLGYIQDGPFSFGVAVHGVQDRIHNAAGYALAASLGATYRHIPEKLTFGVALIHPKIGDGELYTSTSLADTTFDIGYGADLPSSFRAGGFWRDTLKSIPYAIAADVILRTPGNKFMVPLGVEVRPVAPLAIRMGKKLFMETELINLGLGLDIAPLGVDLSFVVPRLVDDAEVKFLAALTYSPRDNTPEKKNVKKPRDTNTLIISPAEETKVSPETKKSNEANNTATESATEMDSDPVPDTETPNLDLGPPPSEEPEENDSPVEGKSSESTEEVPVNLSPTAQDPVSEPRDNSSSEAVIESAESSDEEADEEAGEQNGAGDEADGDSEDAVE